VGSFLVESYLPRSSHGLEVASAQALRAAESAADEGFTIRYVRTTLVATDEICFHMFDADSLATVETAMSRVDLAADRIVQVCETDPNPSDGGAT
jgi:hypothetical protein